MLREEGLGESDGALREWWERFTGGVLKEFVEGDV